MSDEERTETIHALREELADLDHVLWPDSYVGGGTGMRMVEVMRAMLKLIETEAQ